MRRSKTLLFSPRPTPPPFPYRRACPSLYVGCALAFVRLKNVKKNNACSEDYIACLAGGIVAPGVTFLAKGPPLNAHHISYEFLSQAHFRQYFNLTSYSTRLLIPPTKQVWGLPVIFNVAKVCVACKPQTYFRSSFLSLCYPSVIFRRERSDDRKYVCLSQAKVCFAIPRIKFKSPLFILIIFVLAYYIKAPMTIIHPLNKRQLFFCALTSASHCCILSFNSACFWTMLSVRGLRLNGSFWSL